jgi:hypothetical protein
MHQQTSLPPHQVVFKIATIIFPPTHTHTRLGQHEKKIFSLTKLKHEKKNVMKEPTFHVPTMQSYICILPLYITHYIINKFFFSGIWPHKFRHVPQLLKPIIDDVGWYLGILHD